MERHELGALGSVAHLVPARTQLVSGAIRAFEITGATRLTLSGLVRGCVSRDRRVG